MKQWFRGNVQQKQTNNNICLDKRTADQQRRGAAIEDELVLKRALVLEERNSRPIENETLSEGKSGSLQLCFEDDQN